MKNILVIGCGLIGSSLVKAIKFKKISQNIYVIEKSRQYLQILRKSNLHCKVYRPRQPLVHKESERGSSHKT